MILFATPHRGMFFTGMLQSVLVMLPWWIELILRTRDGALDWPWPAVWWHALMLIYGVFPFFIFGFLLTVIPRWQNQPDLQRRDYAWIWVALTTGWLLLYAGFVVPALRVAGLLVVACGWAGVCVRLLPIALLPGRGRLHAMPAWLALFAGWVGWVLLIGLALDGDGRWALWAIDIGLFAFLLPIFLCVCHRMVPFFSNSVLPDYQMVRPAWALWMLLAGAVLHGLLNRMDLAAWRWLVDLPMAALGLWLSVKWRLFDSFKVKLLAMLHVGFAWFWIGMALFGLQSLLPWFGISALGLAPVHALVIGMFSVLVIGMVSRVTLGHSGAPLAADGLTWYLCWALQLVVVVRILAELMPGRSLWLVAASTGWMCVFVLWTLRYLPSFVRPRVDGKAG